MSQECNLKNENINLKHRKMSVAFTCPPLVCFVCLRDQTRRQLCKAQYIIQNEKSFLQAGYRLGGGEVDARDIGIQKDNFKP